MKHIVYILLIAFLSNFLYQLGEQRACNRLGSHILKRLSPTYHESLSKIGKLDQTVEAICKGE